MKPSTLSLLLAPALLFAGCGPSSDPAPEGSEAPESAEASESPPAAEAPTSVEPVSAAEAAALVEANPELVVLDIRRPDEFASGHIAGALNVEYGADGFEAGLSELDPDRPYLVHCRSGGRSSASLPVFESLRFRKLYHLDTGIEGWEEAGLPLER